MILLTGASGKLGIAIQKSGLFVPLFTPSHNQMDITRFEQVKTYIQEHHIQAVIHCAALARIAECERTPTQATLVNVEGTLNLVKALKNKNIYFIYISTDAVYEGKKGLYTEKDEPAPYNVYGHTKLAAEGIVKRLPNHCIVRTSFFDPQNIRFETSATDAYSSKIPTEAFVKDLFNLYTSGYQGIINIGGERMSDFERNRIFKPSLKPCTFENMSKNLPFHLAKDRSMNCSRWRSLQND